MPPYVKQTIGVAPLFTNEDESATYLVGVEAILRIDNEGTLSSEIVDATADLEQLDSGQDWYDCTDCILALVDQAPGELTMSLSPVKPLEQDDHARL